MTPLAAVDPHDMMPLCDGAARELPLLEAALSGDIPARAYADRGAAPRAALVVSRLGWAYALGDPSAPGFIDGAVGVLRDIGGRILWFGATDAMRSAVREHITREIEDHPRVRFSFNAERFTAGDTAKPPLVPFAVAADNIAAVREAYGGIAAFWPDDATFLRRARAFAIAVGGEIAGVAATASVGPSGAEIDVVTAEPYRRSGVAHAACRALIAACIREGIPPRWDCMAANTASRRLAARLGFAEADTYPVIAFCVGGR